jgi:hypothetical protein
MTLPPVRLSTREALRLLEEADTQAALADRQYESSNAADEAYHAWERSTADILNGIFGDQSVSDEFRSGMNVLGSGRRASAMFSDRREKLLEFQTELLLRDLHEYRAELLAAARQTQSHDLVLLLPAADADKLFTRRIHGGEELLASLPRPEAMNDHAYRDAVTKETAYRGLNVGLLRAIFDRNDAADAFDRATTPSEFYMRSEPVDWENLRKIPIEHGTDPKEIVIARVRLQVQELTRWRGKLPDIARIGSSTRPTESEPKATDHRASTVHSHDPGMPKPITVFISYSWDAESHKDWVAKLAAALHQEDDLHVIFDQWDLRPGMDVPLFMDTGLHSDRIVIICTSKYVAKTRARRHGAGYEGGIISAQLAEDMAQDRFIPVIRQGNDRPLYLKGKLYVDFRDDDSFDQRVKDLLAAIRGVPSVLRPVKKRDRST